MRAFLFLTLFASGLFAAGDLSGRRAPGFSLMDTQGRQQDPQDYRGRIFIVEFLATRCPHCGTFSKILEEVRTKYAGKVSVLSVVNPPDNQYTVAAYVKANNLQVPFVFDCGQVAASYFKATPQNPKVEIPHVFIIDAQGMIRKDFGYSPLTRDIFEGNGLFAELDRMLGTSTK